MTGNDVIALQFFLSRDKELYPEGLVTGTYGTLTDLAIRRFQARHGFSQTGSIGPQTRAKLNELIQKPL